MLKGTSNNGKNEKAKLLSSEMEVGCLNELWSREIWFRFGRFIVKWNWIELLDKDKLVVSENDLSPVLNDCRLGRYN